LRAVEGVDLLLEPRSIPSAAPTRKAVFDGVKIQLL